MAMDTSMFRFYFWGFSLTQFDGGIRIQFNTTMSSRLDLTLLH